MNGFFFRTLGLLACVWSLVVCADEPQPIVEVSVSPEEVMVGESLRLEVIVLVPTWFAGTPVFPSFELTNAITRLPPDSAYPTSKRIDGQTWSGIVRHYEVSPLIPATFQLKNQVLRVSWANPGKEPLSADVLVPDINYQGTVPAGAEGLTPFVAGRSLTLDRTPMTIDSLKPGDAVVLEVTATLNGSPAFYIPELFTSGSPPGVRSYPAEPVVTDRTRKEKITWVFDEPGEITIPGISVNWWNTDKKRIDQTTLAPMMVTVTGNPQAQTDRADHDQSDWVWLLAAFIFVFVLALVTHRPLLSRTNNLFVTDAESQAYKHAIKSLRANNAETAYHHLLQWSRIATGQDPVESFTESHQRHLAALRKHVYADQTVPVDFSQLLTGLKVARKQSRQKRAPADRLLPPLNP